jgi:hypothetical protein
MKCHLCGTYLSETAPIWQVGGRKRVAFQCIDQRCASIRIQSRCIVEVIIPDNDIVAYQFLVPHQDKWYRIWARKNSDSPDDTAIFTRDMNGTKNEQLVINVPKFYPLNTKDDFRTKSDEFLHKLRTLIIFS